MTVAYEDAMQIIEDPKAAAWELRDLAKSLLEDLLETQARGKALRDALLNIRTVSGEHTPASHIAIAALNTPSDDTALKQLLAAERERCIDALMHSENDANLSLQECIDVIRALGDKP